MNTPLPLARIPRDDATGQYDRLLPWLALFVRLSVGIALLNAGLAGMMASGPGFGGGPPANPFMTPMGPPGPLPGLETLVASLPYVELALGVGLCFGIFTTMTALACCGLVLVVPAIMTMQLLAVPTPQPGVIVGGPRFMGPGVAIYSVLFAVVSTPCLVVLVLLSPRTINRLSVDALIFARAQVRPPAEPDPGARV